jgi:hypothetical protein
VNIIKAVAAVFCPIFVAIRMNASACQNCEQLLALLRQLVPVAQTNYAEIMNLVKSPINLSSRLIAGTTKINSALKELCVLINKLDSFSFSSRRLCKIGGDFQFSRTILNIVEDINLSMCDLFDQRICVPEESLDFHEIIRGLMPPDDFKDRIAFLLSIDDSYNERITLLLVLHNFFSSAGHCFDTICGTKEMCSVTHLRLEFNNKSLIDVTHGVANTLILLRQRHSERTGGALIEAIEHRQNLPLLAADGRQIAVIPGLPNEFFIADGEQCLYAATLSKWDPTAMRRLKQRIYLPLEIFNEIITSPEQFKGYPAPSLASVSFESLYDITNFHIKISTELIEKIRESLIRQRFETA